ncbi:MAG TPA: glycogen synthase [Anaerolineaceae bacterium]|nr:glycogen synthase [Anaerolineaceae bacterium]
MNAQPANLRVLFLAAEADPLIKVGGLGDVAGTLPRFLRKIDPARTGGTSLDVRLVIPFHPGTRTDLAKISPAGKFTVASRDGDVETQVYQTEIDGLPIYLIAGPYIPKEGPVYSRDIPADGAKFTYFSLATLELARYLDWAPDILHANDWHTALAVFRLRELRKTDLFWQSTKSILSVHNLPFMGAGTQAAQELFGIEPAEDAGLPDWARTLPLPMGLAAADRIMPVSPGYAKEILTPEFGCNLQDYLKTREKDIIGILNGLDTHAWDPQTDPALDIPYSADNLEVRAVNKKALQTEFQLPPGERIPLLTMIGRMDPQKGVDYALEGLRDAVDQSWQAIILGTGDALLEQAAQRLADDYPDRVKAALRFDSRLAHRLYAGADILVMPSRYEPSGLAQMIAMRYGCLPLARSTGGLKDSIVSHTKSTIGTGFLFDKATPAAFTKALRRALAVFCEPKSWETIQRNGMAQDFSWDRSAIAYATVYLEMKGL